MTLKHGDALALLREEPDESFAGSGATLVAAESLGLEAVGYELNREIFKKKEAVLL